MKKINVILLVLFLAANVMSVFAQKPAVVVTNEPGWHKIGDVTASFKKQTESIVVLGADEFTSLKLKVVDAPINIDRVQVFYASGDMEEINVRHELKKGAETAAVALKYPGKDISKVAFTYRTVANSKGEKAQVELFGLKTTQPIGSDSYRDNKEEAKEEAAETRKEIKDDAAEAKQDVKNESNDAGDAISEAAAKTIADIKHKKHDKVGPQGQTIFIDDEHNKLYYINNEGNRVDVQEVQLKDK